MNYLDLFSGIGGFHKGLIDAGIKIDWCGFSEIDKYAKKIYKTHYPESEDLGDVRTIKADRLPRINLITFGFPCQDLSVAGKRAGFHGKRSSLFYEAMRIIESTKPEVFIFENVKGLLSSNQGQDFISVLRTIADLGLYDCEWQLVNTRWFLPQNRERIYFIGHLRGTGRPKVFPIREADIISGRTQQEAHGEGERICSPSINAGYGKVRGGGELFIQDNRLKQIGTIGKDSEATRVYDTSCARTIKNGGGMGAKTGLYCVDAGASKRFQTPILECRTALKATRSDYQLQVKAIPVLTPDRAVKRQNGRRFKEDGEPAFTLTGQDKHGVALNLGIRRLTPIECARLQGFPDTWHQIDGISDSQAYKCYGNAVSVPVVKKIMERLYEVKR